MTNITAARVEPGDVVEFQTTVTGVVESARTFPGVEGVYLTLTDPDTEESVRIAVPPSHPVALMQTIVKEAQRDAD